MLSTSKHNEHETLGGQNNRFFKTYIFGIIPNLWERSQLINFYSREQLGA